MPALTHQDDLSDNLFLSLRLPRNFIFSQYVVGSSFLFPQLSLRINVWGNIISFDSLQRNITYLLIHVVESFFLLSLWITFPNIP